MSNLRLRRVFVFAVVIFFPVWMSAASRDVLVAAASSQVIQNTRADTDNLSRMRNISMVRRFVRNGYLVSVLSRSRYHYLHAVPGAYRYCRPWTKLFLDRLSRQFHARFKQRLRVTSLIRTVASQTRLARLNGNAADAFGPLRSSHLTGASLDISKRSMSPQARRWMRDVLYSLRKQGYIYAIEEFEQPTFHIMVYRSYPKYVRRLERRSPASRRNRPRQQAGGARRAVAAEK